MCGRSLLHQAVVVLAVGTLSLVVPRTAAEARHPGGFGNGVATLATGPSASPGGAKAPGHSPGVNWPNIIGGIGSAIMGAGGNHRPYPSHMPSYPGRTPYYPKYPVYPAHQYPSYTQPSYSQPSVSPPGNALPTATATFAPPKNVLPSVSSVTQAPPKNVVPPQSVASQAPPKNVLPAPSVGKLVAAQKAVAAQPVSKAALPKNDLASLISKQGGDPETEVDEGDSYDYPDDGDGELGRKTQAVKSKSSNDDGIRAKLKLKKKIKEDLTHMLGTIEGLVYATAGAAGLSAQEQKELKEAIEAAKNGDPKKLDAFIKKKKGQVPQTFIDLLEGLKKVAGLKNDLKKGKPLDNKKLQDLKNWINGLTTFPAGLTKSLEDDINKVQAANDLWKQLPPGANGGNGFPGYPGYPGGYPPYPGGYPAYPGGYPPYPGGYPAYPGGYPPAVVGQPVPDATAPGPPTSVDPIVLLNPKSNAASVGYVLGGSYSYDMNPGEEQELKPTSTGWVVSFDRGGSYGTARYTVTDGTYQFVLTDKGWDLVRKQYKVTIDNTNLAGDFGYLADGQQAVVNAGQTRTHTSGSPIEIVFDRGDGSGPARKLLKDGVYQTGIDAQKNRLELFAVGEGVLAQR